jgi:hypothetical protein
MRAIARALDLARRTRQEDLAGPALEAAANAATEALAREAPGPGIVLGLVEVLVVGKAVDDVNPASTAWSALSGASRRVLPSGLFNWRGSLRITA